MELTNDEVFLIRLLLNSDLNAPLRLFDVVMACRKKFDEEGKKRQEAMEAEQVANKMKKEEQQ